MLTVGLFISYFSLLYFFILIHCLVNCSLNDLLEAGHVGASGLWACLSDAFAQNNNSGDKEFVAYDIFSSKILQA